MKPCRVDGCERRVRRVGLCFAHLRRGEDAEVAKRIPAADRLRDGEKKCSSCEQWLPLDAFLRDRDERRGYCKPCHRNRRRVLKYGVSADWYQQTLAEQGGCCAICASPDPRGPGWAIDHDHKCCPDGASSCGSCVRGILCSPCNFALGLFGDRLEVLAAASSYLASHRGMSMVRGV